MTHLHVTQQENNALRGQPNDSAPSFSRIYSWLALNLVSAWVGTQVFGNEEFMRQERFNLWLTLRIF